MKTVVGVVDIRALKDLSTSNLVFLMKLRDEHNNEISMSWPAGDASPEDRELTLTNVTHFDRMVYEWNNTLTDNGWNKVTLPQIRELVEHRND